MQTFPAVVAILAAITTSVSAGATLTTFSKSGCAGTKSTFTINSGVQECIPVTGASFKIDNPKCITAAWQTNDCDGMADFADGTNCNSFNFQSVLVNCHNA